LLDADSATPLAGVSESFALELWAFFDDLDFDTGVSRAVESDWEATSRSADVNPLESPDGKRLNAGASVRADESVAFPNTESFQADVRSVGVGVSVPLSLVAPASQSWMFGGRDPRFS
jgi:hypothetical protein